MKLLRLLAISAVCVAAAGAANANDVYPTKPIELTVAYPPGGGSDNTARALAEAVRPHLSQPTLVINKPGASGSIGWSYVATSPADGYRLVLMTPEMLVVPLMGIGKTTVDDFQPIARFTDDPSSLTVRADSSWKTLEEFMAHAKTNPGAMTISNAGNGTIPHMAAAAFGEAAGLSFSHVPYMGSAPAIMGLLAGDVHATTVAYAELRQHVEAGKLRTLAVMDVQRVKGLNAPTMQEKGLNLHFSVWRGIGAPKATPREVMDKWRVAAKAAMSSPGFLAKLQKQNLTPAYADQPEFAAAVAKQSAAFKQLMPKLNLKQ